MELNYEEPQDAFVYVEKAQYDRVINLIHDIEVLNYLDNNRDENDNDKKVPTFKKLSKYLAKSVGDDKFQVEYKTCDINEGFGRLSVVNGYGLASLPCEVRKYICGDIYMDLDVSNCHPTLINCLMSSLSVQSAELLTYVNNRDEILKKYNVTKVYFMKVMYTDSRFFKGNEFFTAINKAIYEKLVPLLKVQYPVILEQIMASKKKGFKKKNKDGSFLAHVIQSKEFSILRIMVSEFQSMGFKVGAFIHDGLMVEKTKPITEEHLRKVEKTVKDKIKFDIKIIEKSMETILEVKECKLLVCDDEDTAIDEFINLYEDRFVNTTFGPYFKDKFNCWVKMDKGGDWENMLNNLYVTCPISIAIEKKGAVIPTTLKALVPNWKSFTKKITAIVYGFYKDTNFLKRLDNNVGYIIFNDFAIHSSGEIIKSNDSSLTYSKRIEVPLYRKPTKEENDDLFTGSHNLNEIFNDNIKLRDEFFLVISRAIFGYNNDKIFLIGQGGRNSGKGVITEMLRDVFGDLVNTFDSSAFEIRNSNESPEREKSKFASLTSARISIANEVNRKWGADAIKQATSGGDEIIFRESYGRTRKGYIRSSPFVFLNDIPSIDNIDGFQYLLLFNMPCVFNNEEDPNSLYIQKRADIEKKGRFTRDEGLKAAFFWYIVDSFSSAEYPILKQNAKEYVESITTPDPIDKIINLMVIEKNAFLTNLEIEHISNRFDIDVKVGTQKFKLGMEKRNFKHGRRMANVYGYSDKKKCSGFIGLRKKTKDEIENSKHSESQDLSIEFD